MFYSSWDHYFLLLSVDLIDSARKGIGTVIICMYICMYLRIDWAVYILIWAVTPRGRPGPWESPARSRALPCPSWIPGSCACPPSCHHRSWRVEIFSCWRPRGPRLSLMWVSGSCRCFWCWWGMLAASLARILSFWGLNFLVASNSFSSGDGSYCLLGHLALLGHHRHGSNRVFLILDWMALVGLGVWRSSFCPGRAS